MYIIMTVSVVKGKVCALESAAALKRYIFSHKIGLGTVKAGLELQMLFIGSFDGP